MLKNPLFIDFSYAIRTNVLYFDCKHIYMWAVNLLVILLLLVLGESAVNPCILQYICL